MALLLSVSAAAQITQPEDKKAWLKADIAFEKGDYTTALPIYNRLIGLDKDNEEINYRLGVAYFEMQEMPEMAIVHLEKVNPKNNFEVHYYLGRLYHLTGEYEKSIQNYTKYNRVKSFKAYDEKEVARLSYQVQTARLLSRINENNAVVDNLGTAVNTSFNEYAPQLTSQDNQIVFTSRRASEEWPKKDANGNFFESIYWCSNQTNTWGQPALFKAPINTEVHDACTSISLDGQRMLIFRTSEDLQSGNIYESLRSPDGWLPPKVLLSNVNTSKNIETSACYSPDGKLIFFSSDREGGYGGKDLYYVRVLPNGAWGEPFNLGPNINTPYDEHAPFVDPSGSILFFSSEGHQNMGGYDVFKSTFDEQGIFSSPRNLGTPINSTGNDLFFILNSEGNKGYFSSDRIGGFGKQDLYCATFETDDRVDVLVYTIFLQDSIGNPLKRAEMLVLDPETEMIEGKYKSNRRTGKILLVAQPGDVRTLQLEVDGYQTLITEQCLNSEMQLTFTLIPEPQ